MDTIALPKDWNEFITVFLVLLLVALVQILKQATKRLDVPDAIWPLVSLVLAVVFCLAAGTRLSWDPLWSIVVGLITGAAASGFYSWGKTYKS
jgi:steroid 5-alpha reductase family enzyme